MKKLLVSLWVVLALVFAALAVYYWITPAGSLPHHFPGYEAGSTHVHLKHGLAALIVAVAFAILAWFTGGSKDSNSKEPTSDKDS